MLVITSGALLQVVASETKGKLTVRAFFRGDIERVFGDGVAPESVHASTYRLEATVSEDQLADALGKTAAAIDYLSADQAVPEWDSVRRAALISVLASLEVFLYPHSEGCPAALRAVDPWGGLEPPESWRALYDAED